jgi:hypothetical protein
VALIVVNMTFFSRHGVFSTATALPVSMSVIIVVFIMAAVVGMLLIILWRLLRPTKAYPLDADTRSDSSPDVSVDGDSPRNNDMSPEDEIGRLPLEAGAGDESSDRQDDAPIPVLAPVPTVRVAQTGPPSPRENNTSTLFSDLAGWLFGDDKEDEQEE